MIACARWSTALGPVFATARDGALAGLWFEGGRHAPALAEGWIEDPAEPALAACARQLAEWLDGARRGF